MNRRDEAVTSDSTVLRRILSSDDLYIDQTVEIETTQNGNNDTNDRSMVDPGPCSTLQVLALTDQSLSTPRALSANSSNNLYDHSKQVHLYTEDQLHIVYLRKNVKEHTREELCSTILVAVKVCTTKSYECVVGMDVELNTTKFCKLVNSEDGIRSVENTQNILIEGQRSQSETSEILVCGKCAFPSTGEDICQRCRRSLVQVKLGQVSEDLLAKNTPAVVQKITEDKSKRKCSRKKKIVLEPAEEEEEAVEDIVKIDLSSDDDSRTVKENLPNGVSRYPPPATSVFDKEPIITIDEAAAREHDSLRGGGIEMETLLDGSDFEKTMLDCRTVRFGSYKVVPEDKIIITEHGLKLKVPSLSKNNPTTTVKILMKDIVKVLIHFGQTSSAPALFYYITHLASKKIRDTLHMTNKSKNFYFDPTSKEELYKRITLLPEKIHQEGRLFIKSIYESRCLLEELTWEEANDILVRAAPKDVQHTLKKENTSMKQIQSTSTPSGSDIQIIMVYPPTPAKGGIPINTEDYGCLKEGQFLNDVIIDFYLKYLWLNMLSDEDRKRTHIFSSFFYKRLTMLQKTDIPRVSTAEKRHQRVKSWTKSVDIFDKDFIIIPINEKSHWFLGIICFPGLSGPTRISDNAPVPNVIRRKNAASVLAGGEAPAKIWGTTITVVQKEKQRAATISLVENDEDKDDSDRDEAEAEDEDMEPDTSDEEAVNDEDLMDEATHPKRKVKPPQEPIKQPCILILDSYAYATRARVCATLREYLAVEWKVRHKGKSRDFSKDIFKGAGPKVPQQTNFIDCGVYVLQFVETFFKKPIKDYRMPIRSIRDWFTTEEVNKKRFEVKELLLRLMRDQNIDIAQLKLPFLNLAPYSKYEEGEDMMDDELEDGEEFEEEEDDDPGVEKAIMEEEDEDEDELDQYKVDERFKAKRYEKQRMAKHQQLARTPDVNRSSQESTSQITRITSSQQVRIEPAVRIDGGNSGGQQVRPVQTVPPVSTRLEESPRIPSQSVRVEPIQRISDQIRVESVRPRLPDSVSIIEPSSKRKLPLSLKDIRSPRIMAQQSPSDKVKKMRCE